MTTPSTPSKTATQEDSPSRAEGLRGAGEQVPPLRAARRADWRVDRSRRSRGDARRPSARRLGRDHAALDHANARASAIAREQGGVQEGLKAVDQSGEATVTALHQVAVAASAVKKDTQSWRPRVTRWPRPRRRWRGRSRASAATPRTSRRRARSSCRAPRRPRPRWTTCPSEVPRFLRRSNKSRPPSSRWRGVSVSSE